MSSSTEKPNNLLFTTALITGGAGGLGYTLAEWLIEQGKKVIIVGRTEEKLKDAAGKLSQLAAKQVGSEGKEGGTVPYYVLDTGKVGDIKGVVERIVREHEEVDCLINNAGVQRPLKVEEFDLDKADQEIDINIRGPMHLTMALLPHFKTKEHPVIVNVSSVLGYNPFSIINPVYNGTKAFLHFHTMNIRTQLQNSSDPSLSRISVVEIVPPTVATDLHRERDDPDDNKKEKNKSALSVEEFMEQVGQQWKEGKDVLAPGMAEGMVKTWYEAFGGKYDEAAKGGK